MRLALLVTSILLSACAHSIQHAKPQGLEPLRASVTATRAGPAEKLADSPILYDIEVALDPTHGSLNGKARISGAACTGDKLRLRLNGALKVIAIDVDGRPKAATFDPSDAAPFFISRARTFDIPCPEQHATISYAGEADLSADGRNQVSADLIELSLYGAWYPIADISTPVQGRFRTVLPAAWVWASNGDKVMVRATDDGAAVTIEKISPGADFTLVASPHFERLTARAGVVAALVSSDLPATQRGRAAGLAAGAEHALALYQALLGPPRADIDVATLVFTRRGGALSYARLPLIITQQSALVASGDDAGESRPIPLNIRHEIAHFWSNASRRGGDDWINEGIAEYLGLRATRALQSQSAYDRLIQQYRNQSSDSSDTASFTSPAENTYLAKYVRPALLFDALETRFGELAMTAFLRTAAQARAGVTTMDLADIAAITIGAPARERLLECAVVRGHSEACASR